MFFVGCLKRVGLVFLAEHFVSQGGWEPSQYERHVTCDCASLYEIDMK